MPTQSGAAARTFRERIEAGMKGINLGAPAPMGFFRSTVGRIRFTIILLRSAIAFYTRKKMISEHWFGAEGPKE